MDHVHQTTETFIPLVALLLGLGGSLAHCAGMCSGITLLFARRGITSGWRVLLLHSGRTATYAILGLLAGGFGMGITTFLPELQMVQGTMALVMAVLAGYFAISILGVVPSPEIAFSAITRWWGQTMRNIHSQSDSGQAASPALAFGYGMIWGMLPCGFVLTALLAATASGSAAAGSIAMLAFGLGTWPALLAIHWARQHDLKIHQPWMRTVMAILVVAFGAQMAMRGLVAWGWVNHMTVGAVMLW